MKGNNPWNHSAETKSSKPASFGVVQRIEKPDPVPKPLGLHKNSLQNVKSLPNIGKNSGVNIAHLKNAYQMRFFHQLI